MTKSQHSQIVEVHTHIDFRFKNLLQPSFVRGCVSSEGGLSVPVASPESKDLRHGPGAVLPEPEFRATLLPPEATATVSREASEGAQVGKLSSRCSLAGRDNTGRWRAPSCNMKQCFACWRERAQAGDGLVSRWSELSERALVLIILKGSSGTPVTLVIRAESAIFPFTWWEGKGIYF